MKTKSRRFIAVDVLLILLTVLPFIVGILLKILTSPATSGVSITGAQVYFTIPMPIQDLPVSSAQINSLLVMMSIFWLCLFMTHGMSVKTPTRRQLLAEWAVKTLDKLTHENMGEYFAGYAPFVGAILVLSAFSSLSSLLGIFPPTSDLNVVAGWAILVFILLTYYKLKGGLFNYLKGFTEPIFIMTPLNVIGEVATPVSMAFRHYGNVLSGSIIGVLIATALQGLSRLVLGWLPEVLSGVPLLQIGLPGILSLYFDVFSSCIQAYIFAMLTMLNISGAFPQEEYEKRMQKKLNRKNKKQIS